MWKDIQSNHTSVEKSIIVRDGELHGVHRCSDIAAENWAKIDREAREDSQLLQEDTGTE